VTYPCKDFVFLTENALIIMGDLFLLKVLKKIGLFSKATAYFEIPKTISASVHTYLKLVYFYG
jgi:hypothetical protein